MTCQHCAVDASEYRAMCGGCVIRRASRLSASGLDSIIAGIQSERGPGEALAFRENVCRERDRLAGIQKQ